jgi:hypothetical protein
LLQPDEWECTTKVFVPHKGKGRQQLNQEQIRNLMPQWIARQQRDGKYPQVEGDPTKFLFDVEPVVHFAKARYAAKSGSIVRYVTQAMIRRKRASGEADFDFGGNPDDEEEDDSFANLTARPNSSSNSAGGARTNQWVGMGAALDEIVKPNGSVPVPGAGTGTNPTNNINLTSTAASGKNEDDREENDNEEEDEEENEDDGEDNVAPAPISAPAVVPPPVVATKPGIMPVSSAPAISKSRRATKKA